MSLYGFIIGLCLSLGFWYFEKHNKIIPKNRETIFAIGLIISSIIGARAYHVIDYWDYYSNYLSQIPATWNGGLAIYGGLIGGVIYITLYSWIFKHHLIPVLDSIAPIVPLLQAFGRLGNFFNRENPLWWPEAILNLILFLILKSNLSHKFSPAAIYLIGYGLIRFVTEFGRTDTWMVDGVKIAHLISLVFIFMGVLIYKVTKTTINKNG